MKNIYLFTNQYPFGTLSETFLETEMDVAAQLDAVSITVVPINRLSTSRTLPDGIKLDCRLAARSFFMNIKAFFALLSSRWLWRLPFDKSRPRTMTAWLYAIKYLFGGFLVRDFITKNAASFTSDAIFYSYWSNHTVFGFALAKQRHPMLSACRFIARAHGYDLYENLVGLCAPYRPFVFENIDKTYTVSRIGKDFLSERYPGYSHKIALSRLGAVAHENRLVQKQDAVIRIVSCSSVIPLKRVELILSSLASFAQCRNEQDFEWVHLGGGSLFDDLKAKAESIALPNLKIELVGNVAHTLVIDFFETHFCDLFVNLSTTEGVPVSIMEAMSFGIPVLATDVGGNSEIVTPSSGALIPKDFAQQALDDAIEAIISDPQLRTSTLQFFEENYDARNNFTKFYQKEISE